MALAVPLDDPLKPSDMTMDEAYGFAFFIYIGSMAVLLTRFEAMAPWIQMATFLLGTVIPVMLIVSWRYDNRHEEADERDE